MNRLASILLLSRSGGGGMIFRWKRGEVVQLLLAAALRAHFGAPGIPWGAHVGISRGASVTVTRL